MFLSFSVTHFFSLCPEHIEFSFTIFLIIFNFRLLLFSCCSDTVSLRGSIKFHLIWTWWNCVRLSEELSLLYLVHILNWVWCCVPAALILRLMDFYSPRLRCDSHRVFEGRYLFLLHLYSTYCHHIFTLHVTCWVCVEQLILADRHVALFQLNWPG